jgi:hypothetical protein
MSTDRIEPQEVGEAPELLVLATLDSCLDTLTIALIAAFPRIADEYAPQRDGPAWRAAVRLSKRADLLSRAIMNYRKVLRAQLEPPPDPLDSYF